MKKIVILLTLIIGLTSSFAFASPRQDLPIILVNQILFETPGKIVAITTDNIQTADSFIPSGTKLVFFKSARTKDTHLSKVNVSLVRGIMPEGQILTPQGQESINVNIVFTNPESMKWIEGGKGVDKGAKAKVVFVEQADIMPLSLPHEPFHESPHLPDEN